MTPKVAIIIVNWNGKLDTLDCLGSLRDDSYTNKSIIVVDNGSSDDSLASFAMEFPEVTVIENRCNLGFTGGNNRGIEKALAEGADYVYLLNNDTVSESDALTLLLSVAEADSSLGVLTPVIHYYDHPNLVWFSGSRIELSTGLAIHDNSDTPNRSVRMVEIPWASGCAMLIPRRVLERVGGFDERYFLNWEDVDLCLRVRAAGFNVALVPAARIRHKVGRSFAVAQVEGTYYYVRNQLLFCRLHGGPFYFKPFLRTCVRSLRRALSNLRRRKPHSFYGIFIVLKAMLDACIGRFGIATHL